MVRTEPKLLEEETVKDIAEKAVQNGAGPDDYLTFEDLSRKPRRAIEFDLTTVGADGKPKVGKLKFVGLNQREYDDLVAAHPPNMKDKTLGAQYDKDTFPPALVSAVSNRPKLTVEQAAALMASDNWSSGETLSLFLYAQRVSNAGIDVPFNDRG